MKRCNICGVPEEKWTVDMVCRDCGSVCEVRPQDIIDERIYKYAEKNGVLMANRLNRLYMKEWVDSSVKFKSIPKYILDYLK